MAFSNGVLKKGAEKWLSFEAFECDTSLLLNNNNFKLNKLLCFITIMNR